MNPIRGEGPASSTPSKSTFPAVGRSKPAEQTQQGAFPAAGRPDHAHELLARDGKGDFPERAQFRFRAGELLRQIFSLQDRSIHLAFNPGLDPENFRAKEPFLKIRQIADLIICECVPRGGQDKLVLIVVQAMDHRDAQAFKFLHRPGYAQHVRIQRLSVRFQRPGNKPVIHRVEKTMRGMP